MVPFRGPVRRFVDDIEANGCALYLLACELRVGRERSRAWTREGRNGSLKNPAYTPALALRTEVIQCGTPKFRAGGSLCTSFLLSTIKVALAKPVSQRIWPPS